MENYYVASICLAEQIGCMRAKQLIEHFGSAQRVWETERLELESEKFPDRIIDSLFKLKQAHPNCPEEIFDYCNEKGIRVCSYLDKNYPEIMNNMKDSPAILYYKGELKSHASRIAIVGTRQSTQYGRNVALTLASDIAKEDITIVSGAALGIDRAAHIGALKTGRTIAILGGGLELNYSSENQNLFNEIIENGGAVISEYAPTTPANKGTFPHRNRIIAGLSIAVIVVEAGKQSGALNTAQHAGVYGRLVFAVPNNIYSNRSQGCHDLIRDGAILARSAKEILDDCKIKSRYSEMKSKVVGMSPLEGNEELVCKNIPFDVGISAEELSIKLEDISLPELTTILLNLEMKSYINKDIAGNYLRLYGNY